MSDVAERLRTEPTEEDVLAYLLERSSSIKEAGGVAVPAEWFWQHGDLGRYLMCEAVWAKDAPPVCALPDLPTLLNAVAGPVGMAQTTFMEDLLALWRRYAAWCHAEGRDPNDPRETAATRRTRRARESMARTRARRAGTDPERTALLEEAKRLHDAYLEACRWRKDQLIGLDALVRDAWAAYEAARDAAKA